MGDAQQPAGRVLAEVGGEVEDDQEAVGLRDLACLGVVLLDGGILVAQVLLDNILHVLSEFGQALLDVRGLAPSAVGNQLFVIVGQAHEGGHILAQTDGIYESEAEGSGGNSGEETEEERLNRCNSFSVAAAIGAEEQRALGRNREEPGKF